MEIKGETMKIKKYRVYLWMVISLIILQSFKVYASDTTISDKEVVFVLDASGSMKTNDPNRLAIDSIAQLIYTLPTNYKVGLIAYNTEVVISQEPIASEGRGLIMTQAEEVKYEGYTNAGTGLYQAVKMIGKSNAIEKHIVLLSDGEILMANDSATLQSVESYRLAISEAVQNEVHIHVIGLGNEMENTANSIFTAASESGGSTYYTPQAVGIQQAIDAILDEQLHIKRIAAAIIDLENGMETLSFEMPFTYASKVRVLLTSDGAIRNLNTNFQADNAKQINGERYSLIEIDRPKSSHLNLSFSGAAGDRVAVTLIPEYQVIPKAVVTYEDNIPLTEAESYYTREARITYSFYDAENENIQLWTEDFFNHNLLLLETEAETCEAALNQGQFQMKKTVTEYEVLHTTIDYSKFTVNIIGITEVEVSLEEPPLLPLEEPEPEPPYVLIILGTLLVIVLIALIWVVKLKNSEPALAIKSAAKEENRPEPGKYSYVGRLNLYITRTKSGYEIPPLSYDLFRLPQTKVISLAEVLESCGVSEVFEGANRIYIKSGAGRSIILTNQSHCTIMKSSEILMKNKSYELKGNAKVDVMFEDEVSELTFQYRDLRSSEMW